MSMEKLQAIRNRRLEKQMSVLQEHKNKVNQAEQALLQAKQAIEHFQGWRLEQQEKMFQGLQGQSFSPSTISDYHNQLDSFSHKEEELRQALEQSHAQLQKAQNELAQARQHTNQLAMKNEKTKAIVETLNKENHSAESE